MRPGISAPYYLAGNSKRRWHTNQAEQAGLAAGSAALAHHYLKKNSNVTLHSTLSPHDSRQAMKYAAVGIGAYGGYHAVQSTRLAHQNQQKRKRVR